MQVYFLGKRQLTDAVWQYDFRPERPLDYVAGQYVELHLPDIDDPRGPARTFTLTSLPSEPQLSFASKLCDSASPYKEALHTLRPGDAAKIDDAMGDVILPKLPGIPLVFIAGGLGMASYVSMLRTLQQTGEQRTIHLLYALRSSEDDAFQELVDSFPFASQRRFVRPDRLQLSDITDCLTDDTLVYLSGSQHFVESLYQDVQNLGVENSRIIFDFFDGYKEL